MACTWSSKVNGILTVAAIGFAVLIDLWGILDFKKGHSMVRGIRLLALGMFYNRIFPGILLEAFRGEGYRFNCPTTRPISVLLLHPSLDPHPLRTGRYLHEPRLPGDPRRQRAIAQQSRYFRFLIL